METKVHGAPIGAFAEDGQLVGGQDDAMLLMVERRDSDSNSTVLWSLSELQPGGTVNHTIPYRTGCAYALFQGEPAKSYL